MKLKEFYTRSLYIRILGEGGFYKISVSSYIVHRVYLIRGETPSVRVKDC